MTINQVHRLVYFVPEAAEEYAALGVTGRSAYFGSRAAPLGAVSDEVIIATFYNFSPGAVRSGCADMWRTASPEAFQAARFRVVARALSRVGVGLTAEQVAAARSIIDPAVAALDLAGKPLGAANAGLALPENPLSALWQQVTVLREFRGDAHLSLLVANEIGPCDCMVLQVGTGRFPLGITQASRQWSEQEWSASIERLAVRGWMDDSGAMTDAGIEARERLEADTDRLCAPIWNGLDDATLGRLDGLLARIHAAMVAVGTYAALA